MINYVVGDATQPQGEGNKIIVHICNDIGAWGAGFVKALSAKWYEPEAYYHGLYNAYKNNGKIPQGIVQFIEVGQDITVANMVAQNGIVGLSNPRPVNYESLAECLETVANYVLPLGDSVHMPRIGCGLAGGDWSVVESIIDQQLVSRGVSVTVYDLES